MLIILSVRQEEYGSADGCFNLDPRTPHTSSNNDQRQKRSPAATKRSLLLIKIDMYGSANTRETGRDIAACGYTTFALLQVMLVSAAMGFRQLM